jgi:hypothetical protein
MTIHRLWTLCIVGEPEEGGTPVLHVGRLTDEEYNRPDTRSMVEETAHKLYPVEHPGHVIASEWWACEEREVREL